MNDAELVYLIARVELDDRPDAQIRLTYGVDKKALLLLLADLRGDIGREKIAASDTVPQERPRE